MASTAVGGMNLIRLMASTAVGGMNLVRFMASTAVGGMNLIRFMVSTAIDGYFLTKFMVSTTIGGENLVRFGVLIALSMATPMPVLLSLPESYQKNVLTIDCASSYSPINTFCNMRSTDGTLSY